MPTISVIVPVFNAERYLDDTLKSIEAQTFADFEVLLVDDGSTDGSRAILEDYAQRDSRFRIINGPALGRAGLARNLGIEHAKGEFLAFIDADDLLEPTMFEKLHRRAMIDSSDIVIAGFSSFYEDERVDSGEMEGVRTDLLPLRRPFSPEEVSKSLFSLTTYAPWNKLYRASLISQHDIKFQDLRRANDVYFTCLALAFSERISVIEEVLIYYRRGNPDSLSGKADATPIELLEILPALKQKLEEEDLVDTFFPSLGNLLIRMSVESLRRCQTARELRDVFGLLRNFVLREYRIDNMHADDYDNKNNAKLIKSITNHEFDEWLLAYLRTTQKHLQHTHSAVLRWKERAGEIASRREQAKMAAREKRLGKAPAPKANAANAVDVSVIVPVYNVEDYVEECVNSVLRQTGVSLEVICVNDGSTDQSKAIVENLAQGDNRVKVINQENQGLSGARNTGMKASRGRYILFIDSDDILLDDKLSILVEEADQKKLDMLLFDGDDFYEDGDEQLTQIFQVPDYKRHGNYDGIVTGLEMFARMRANGEYRPNVYLYLLKRSFVKSQKVRFIPNIIHEDIAFTFTLMHRAKRVAHNPAVLYGRRIRSGSIMVDYSVPKGLLGYFTAYHNVSREISGVEYDKVYVADGVYHYTNFLFDRAVDLFEKSPSRVRYEFRNIINIVDTADAKLAARQIVRTAKVS